jgi:hypothetical protein
LPEFVDNKKNRANKITLINDTGDSRMIQNKSVGVEQVSQGCHESLFNIQTSIIYYNIKKYLSANLVSKNKENTVLPIELKIEGVLNNLFKVLSLFTNKKINIVVNFSCLNKNLNFLKRTQKKKFVLLQKFKGTPFLREGIELLFHTVYTSNSASLLAKFVAIQVKKVKRHKLFLSFLKHVLTILISSSFSKVKGIKIIIKGRLNGVPRAKHKIISIGDVPIQSISAIIDHAQSTAHNSNGSYGIKVWMVEKS